MQFTIVGAGAIGCLWAASLAKAHSVHLWTRNSQPYNEFNFTPLDRASTPEPSETLNFPSNQAQLLQQSDCVLITVKAFQVEQAIKAIQPWLSPFTPVIVMHNGMGSQAAALAALPNNPLLYAITSQAAFKPKVHHIQHTGIGQTWLGAINSTAQSMQALAEILNQALAPCQWHHDIQQPLWQKLAINCAINPLTALHQCKNGDLAQQQYQTALISICQEVADIMCAEGYVTTTETLKDQVDRVIHATANNLSSMNQDVCHHRPTEIDYITGHIVRRGQHYNIRTPFNAQLWQQIKTMEQKAS
ncbi:2-dehydropantoate 2-reductase [Photobacterium sanguinicancri]|uniref:2-dehydropantoate 2-reductase n=1 Tax=Photobacterium sanguinicancri TaxID=875932 RepID=UPI003D0D05B8